MRILLFGMRCRFTPPVLEALIASGHEIAAVVLPGRIPGQAWRWIRVPGAPKGVPIAGNPTIESLAMRHDLAVAELGRGDIEPAVEEVTELRPDLVVAACFPRLIPKRIIDLAPLGGWNLHPSVLPRFRGPDPLFWTLHAGLDRSGVTVHRLSESFDSGDIVALREVNIAAGERIDRLETVMGRVGGDLLVETLAQWSEEDGVTEPQDDRLATSAPNPQPRDFRVPTSWPAERAFRFIHGVAPLGVETEIFDCDGEIWRVRDAGRWGGDSDGWPPLQDHRGEIEIAFSDGVLRVISA